jgi:DNA-binding NtrC family response regulator
MVVDDDVAVAKALSRLLELEGFSMHAVHDGREAIEQLGAGGYDVLLVDLQMPNLDGMEVFERVKRCNTPPATILHSAFLDVQTAVRALRAGVSDVLQKPVPEPLLAARIRELTAQRRISLGLNEGTPAASGSGPLSSLVGATPEMQMVRSHIGKVARFPRLPVLIEGPTGTGKELVAEAIHALSAPAAPFISLNCAAVSEHLFESELFGHEAGAFTSAKGSRAGLLEEAGVGTVFLDEVGEMPQELQAKLLRVLETRRFRRVGSNQERMLNARVVSATNRPLTGDVGESLRPDLYFRLAGYTIHTPALVDHLSDVPLIAGHIATAFARQHQLAEPVLSDDALRRLQAHGWPGNVRELRSVTERAIIMASGGIVGLAEVEQALSQRSAAYEDARPRAATAPRLPPRGRVSGARAKVLPREEGRATSGRLAATSGEYASLPELQRDVTLQAFEQAAGNLSMAARDLGIPRSTLRRRLQKYGAR